MPKEIVYADDLPFGKDDPRKAVAEVRWGRDGYMQLVTKCLNRADESEIRDENAPIGEILVENGFYISLDRQGINELIRHLRRARDQAYGRDE